MRRTVVSVAFTLLAVFGVFPAAHAQVAPPIVNQPAATLLLPYFEVDLDNEDGMTTLFSINNSSATALLAHVTLWSDLGVPVFAFNVYLTGFDVQRVDMRDILVEGRVPRTASVGQDPGDTISNQGPFSQDINFASCNGKLGTFQGQDLSIIPASHLDHLRASLTGGASSIYGACAGRDLGTPGIARGYVTVDTVNNCTLRFPSDPGYFVNGGAGDATNQNILWGDYIYLDRSRGLAHGDSLVHLRASGPGFFPGPPGDPETSTPGQYTFYGRLVDFTAADNREPLATNFAARFLAPKDFKGDEIKARRAAAFPPGTELIVWRDPKIEPEPFACGSTPSWYPLTQEQVRAFDEQEESEAPTFTTDLPFPASTQRVAVSPTLPLTIPAGWLYLNLNTTVAGSSDPPEDAAASQAWVTVVHRVLVSPNGGRYDAGFRAIRLDSARAASHDVID
jgi:hypothetical protein